MSIASALLCVSFAQATSDALPARARELPKLASPIRVEAFGKPIVAVTGHAAPFVVDHDGDGLPDLIVGMYGSDLKGVSGGTARFYKNLGTRAAPRFDGFSTLRAQGKFATMESN
jgi:hypothetical protein